MQLLKKCFTTATIIRSIGVFFCDGHTVHWCIFLRRSHVPLVYFSAAITRSIGVFFQAAAKEAAGQATQLIAAAQSAGPSNRNQTSQQQLTDQCKVSQSMDFSSRPCFLTSNIVGNAIDLFYFAPSSTCDYKINNGVVEWTEGLFTSVVGELQLGICYVTNPV